MIDYALLGLLRDGPDYGYNLKRRFEERMGAVWTLNVGQIYQTLRHLETRALIAPVGDPESTAHRTSPRRLVAITPKGQRALEQWFRRPPARPKPVRDETLVRLLILAPDQHSAARGQIAKLEHLHRLALGRLLAQETSLATDAAGGDPGLVRRLALQAALLHTEAHLEWLARCRESLQHATMVEPDRAVAG